MAQLHHIGTQVNKKNPAGICGYKRRYDNVGIRDTVGLYAERNRFDHND